MERMLIPVVLPSWLASMLRGVKRAFVPPKPVLKTIDGERYVEWSFLSSHLPEGSGEAIDFGCENGYMSLLAAQKGFHVRACDLQEQHFLWKHPNVEFILGDFLHLGLPRNHFDLIINCSSVEHVGVAGRYGVTASETDGDLEVMTRFSELLTPQGIVIMTAPCGTDAVMAPWCRVYGQERLPKLLAPFLIERECYWIKDHENRWVETSKEKALNYAPRHDPANPHGCSYALGGFVLRKRADRRVGE